MKGLQIRTLLSSLQVKRLQNVVVADVMRGGLLCVEVVGGVAPHPHHQYVPLLPLLTPHVPPHTLHTREKASKRLYMCSGAFNKKLKSDYLVKPYYQCFGSGINLDPDRPI